MKTFDRYEKEGAYHWKWYKPGRAYKRLVDESLDFFPCAGSIIDMGCGDGLVSSLLTKRGFRVMGIDSSSKALELAKKKCSGLDIHFGWSTLEDYASFGFTLDFDYLYSLNTIEHVDSPKAFVRLMKRIRRFAIIITDDGEHEPKGEYDKQLFNSKDLKELFKGFKTEALDLSDKQYIGIKVYAKK